MACNIQTIYDQSSGKPPRPAMLLTGKSRTSLSDSKLTLSTEWTGLTLFARFCADETMTHYCGRPHKEGNAYWCTHHFVGLLMCNSDYFASCSLFQSPTITDITRSTSHLAIWPRPRQFSYITTRKRTIYDFFSFSSRSVLKRPYELKVRIWQIFLRKLVECNAVIMKDSSYAPVIAVNRSYRR